MPTTNNFANNTFELDVSLVGLKKNWVPHLTSNTTYSVAQFEKYYNDQPIIDNHVFNQDLSNHFLIRIYFSHSTL